MSTRSTRGDKRGCRCGTSASRIRTRASLRSRRVMSPARSYPEVGITSTPVIDYSTGTLYVLARTKERKGMFSGDEYVQKLHALAITTGIEKFGGPVVIGGSVPGRASGGSGAVAFEALRENPRAALLLANGKVYLTWASSCDVGTYYGWVMAYDALTLKQVGLFNASPDAAAGGIWLSDTGPAADSAGNVYVVTGNGWFNAAQGDSATAPKPSNPSRRWAMPTRPRASRSRASPCTRRSPSSSRASTHP